MYQRLPLLAQHLDVQLGVLEGLSELSAFALDGDDAVVDRRPDALGDLHLQTRVNRLHFWLSFFVSLKKITFKLKREKSGSEG